MIGPADQIVTHALSLSPDERERLAEALAASLPVDPGLAEAWDEEAERRFQAYLAGEMKAYPAEQVIAEARARLERQRSQCQPPGLSLEGEQIRKAALKLSAKEREAIAEALFTSLPVDPEIEAAWSAVIQRRIEDLESGRVKGIPAEEVFREIEELIGSDDSDEEIAEAWGREAHRRLQEILAGDAQTIPMDEAMAIFRARLARNRSDSQED